MRARAQITRRRPGTRAGESRRRRRHAQRHRTRRKRPAAGDGGDVAPCWRHPPQSHQHAEREHGRHARRREPEMWSDHGRRSGAGDLDDDSPPPRSAASFGQESVSRPRNQASAAEDGMIGRPSGEAWANGDVQMEVRQLFQNLMRCRAGTRRSSTSLTRLHPAPHERPPHCSGFDAIREDVAHGTDPRPTLARGVRRRPWFGAESTGAARLSRVVAELLLCHGETASMGRVRRGGAARRVTFSRGDDRASCVGRVSAIRPAWVRAVSVNSGEPRVEFDGPAEAVKRRSPRGYAALCASRRPRSASRGGVRAS